MEIQMVMEIPMVMEIQVVMENPGWSLKFTVVMEIQDVVM